MPNKVRGEVELTIGSETVVLCAEMQRLAVLSDALSNPPLHDIFIRISGTEPRALFEATRAFAFKGDAERLIDAAQTYADLEKIRDAAADVLNAFKGDPKNGESGTANP